MQTFHHFDDVPRDFGPAILSVGNFDGVHRAHRHVIDEIVRRAKAQNAHSMVVSFEPHPAPNLHPD
jgi:riboflavin kinase/FMN adenylyltransferase